ncbi:hypothetical protein AURDEDRAFT_112643 [Auricularia subglabra TFB-10046 SS5]|nr:hypothetical protein AURDEDRAFT_112643 [Auricularia subglabra TFB-10046 SS5]
MRLYSAALFAGAAIGASAFSYHDNAATLLSLAQGFTFNAGSYFLSDFHITGGQDPNHHISVGQVRSFVAGGSMVFSVGRKGSGDVASWWSARIGPGQNTFGNNPGALNFAFLGSLSLNLSGGVLPGATSFTITNVGLAQGHTLGANNWWFGGQTCVRGSGDFVRCAGTRDGTGETWHFTFLRGSEQPLGQVDVVYLAAVEAS